MSFQRGCATGWACLCGDRRVRKTEFDTWKWEARDTIWGGEGGSLRKEVQPISYKQSGVNPELRTSTGRSRCDGCPGVCESESRSVVSDSLRPHIVHGILQAGILEWVAFPFYRGSFQPRDQTQVFCIAGGFFTSRATTEAWTVISS